MSLRTVVSVPGRRSLVVTCDAAKQCHDVAKVEKARPENQKRGALIGIEAYASGRRGVEPLVFWLHDGTGWVKELV